MRSKLKEIRRRLRESKIPAIEGFELSASIGAAMAKKQKIEEVVKRADQMMYQAKSVKNTITTEWKHVEPLEGFKENAGSKKQRQKVLIVDDSEMNRIILHEMLCEEFDMIEATNGREGLDILEREGRHISLVLLDIVMPVMDGFGVLKRMKEKRMIEEIPVIVISAEVSIPTIRQAYEMGVADYISRPFDAQIVYNRVFNTIKLYAKQRRSDEDPDGSGEGKRTWAEDYGRYSEPDCRIPKRREWASCSSYQYSDPDVAGTTGTADGTVSDFPDAKRSDRAGIVPA